MSSLDDGSRQGVPGLLARPYRFLRLEWTSEFGLLRVRTCVTPIWKLPATAPAVVVAVSPVPLAVAVNCDRSLPLARPWRAVCMAPSAADKVPKAEIWVLSLFCSAVSAPACPAIFAFTSAVVRDETSSVEFPVAPLMMDCAAAVWAAWAAALAAAT